MRAPWDGIRVVGTLWSAGSHEAKDFLARNRIPYRWLDLDRDPEARALAETLPADARKLPLLFFPDGAVLSAPPRRDIAEKVGLRTQAPQKFYDLVVIGGGPAGLAAAVYGASEGLKTVLIEREATGGQAGTSSRIENYLGFPSGLSGADLARARDRAGAPLRRRAARGAGGDRAARRAIRTAPSCSATAARSTATRWWSPPASRCASWRCPGAEQVTGAGLYYGAALTEAAHYRDRDVIVVGGANSAGQGAVFFSHYARQRDHARARQVAGRVDVALPRRSDRRDAQHRASCPRPRCCEVKGTDRLEARGRAHAATAARRGRSPAAAVFVFIGARPRTEFCDGVLARDPGGFIITGLDLVATAGRPPGWPPGRLPALLETSVPGIFAAGDVRHGSSKRVAAAVGEGAVAVQLIHQYLKTV